jgi:hypothetical protein
VLTALLWGTVQPINAQAVHLGQGDTNGAEGRPDSLKTIPQEELLSAIDDFEVKDAILLDESGIDPDALAQALESEKINITETVGQSTDSILQPMQQTAGYIVFLGTFLLALRSPSRE